MKQKPDEISKTILVTPLVIGFGYLKTDMYNQNKKGENISLTEIINIFLPFMVFTIAKYYIFK